MHPRGSLVRPLPQSPTHRFEDLVQLSRHLGDTRRGHREDCGWLQRAAYRHDVAGRLKLHPAGQGRTAVVAAVLQHVPAAAGARLRQPADCKARNASRKAGLETSSSDASVRSGGRR